MEPKSFWTDFQNNSQKVSNLAIHSPFFSDGGTSQFLLKLYVWWTKQEHVQETYSIESISNKLTLIGRFLTDICDGMPQLIICKWDDIRYVGDIFYKIYGMWGGTPESNKKIHQMQVFFAPASVPVDWDDVCQFLNRTE